jgi:hypothetical protein
MTITLPSDTENKLIRLSQKAGTSLDAFLATLVSQLPESGDEMRSAPKPTTGRYAARMAPLLEEMAKSPPLTREEQKAAEQEVQDILDALNEHRRHDGADLL